MENGSPKKWRFRAKSGFTTSSALSISDALRELRKNLNKEDERTIIPLAHGDPSSFPSYATTSVAVDSIVDTLKSAKYNAYPPFVGIPPARRAIAEHLNSDLPYKLTEEDVFVTSGCRQAIDVSLTVLSRPGANILLPRPGYPYYEAITMRNNIEFRHFDLVPEKGWEVDLQAVEELADENTAAICIVNPGNPCGNVYSYEHMKKIAETARKLGILVISDEVYAHLTFGSNPFVPMGVFGSIAPVITLGGISKRWLVPGWRLGWLALNDPNGILKKYGVVDSIKGCFGLSYGYPNFIQGAIPEILVKTDKSFFQKITNLLRESVDLCYDKIQEIPCLTCTRKPEGSMFVMTKLNLTALEGIKDDMDFCLKLSKEESVLILPGVVLGMKNWIRITFAAEIVSLEDGFGRLKAFCERHAKKK